MDAKTKITIFERTFFVLTVVFLICAIRASYLEMHHKIQYRGNNSYTVLVRHVFGADERISVFESEADCRTFSESLYIHIPNHDNFCKVYVRSDGDMEYHNEVMEYALQRQRVMHISAPQHQ